jgi:hypothetical protein
VYVAHFSGAVSRIQASTATPACAPQLTLPAAPIGTAPPDAKGPGLTVDLRKGRRAGARGELTAIVRCDESCTVRGAGKIAVPGKDLGLDANTLTLAANVPGALRLDLSGSEASRLLRKLRGGAKAKAKVALTAIDGWGNASAARRKIPQKP